MTYHCEAESRGRSMKLDIAEPHVLDHPVAHDIKLGLRSR